MRGWFPYMNNGHDHFFNAFSHLGSYKYAMERKGLDIDNRLFVEIINRNRLENVQYLEIMTGCVPGDIVQMFKEELANFEGFDAPALSKLKGTDLEMELEDVMFKAYTMVKPLIVSSSVRDGIGRYLDKLDQAIQQTLSLSDFITGNSGDLVVRYIPSIKRYRSLKRVFIDAVTGLLSVDCDDRVVALDIVAPEDGPVSRRDFTKHMLVLDFLWRQLGHPKYTLHAGELSLRESPMEPMMDRIRQSIVKGHALRIGHGVSIGWERDMVGLLDLMKTNGILIEICLTSNDSILGIKEDDHPFGMYFRAGVPMSINTDDAGLSRSNLTMEFIKAIQTYDLSYQQVKTLVRNSLEYSFLPGKSLFVSHDYTKIDSQFKNIYSTNWKPSKLQKKIMSEHPKLHRQIVLELAWKAFEYSLQNGFRE